MKAWLPVAGALVVVAVLVAGCLSGTGTGGVTPTVAKTTTASATAHGGGVASPSVLILDPVFDGGVSAGDVTVTCTVTGFALATPGEPNRPGEGHLVYYRDVTPRTVPGETALTAPGTCVVSSDTAHTWNGIPPGTHTFTVQLVNGDDTPLDPPAIDAVDVTAVSPGMIAAP